VHVVLVNSPGSGRAPHWSRKLAGAFSRLAVARGAKVRWLAAMHPHEESPLADPGVEVLPIRRRRSLFSSRAAAAKADAAMELALTEALRAEPRSVVVHVGVGGQGSPNPLWLADRLGSATFASARGPELVCNRSELLDRHNMPCRFSSESEQCRWCGAPSMSSTQRSVSMQNREDLLVAALQTCAAILVPGEEDADLLQAVGVAAKRVSVGASAAELADRVLSAR